LGSGCSWCCGFADVTADVHYKTRVLAWTLISTGVIALGYLAWLFWGTDLQNDAVQTEASVQLDETLDRTTPDPEQVDTGNGVIEYFAEDPVGIGEPFGYMTIPAIQLVDVAIFEGVDRDTLKSGPGHVQASPLPGQPGNAVMSGHRTTYGKPFFDFDLLEVGDEVEVETAVGTHLYAIREVAIVAPTDVWVADPRPGGWLTLTTCEPKFSARHRLVVFAEMVDGPNLEFVEYTRIADRSR
jgi:sortase A